MALTDHKREVAYEMFSQGETSTRVARRIRESVPSTAALKANWTRNLTPAQLKKVQKLQSASS